MGRKHLMSHAIVKGTQLQISNLRATSSMQIWTWEEISSRNPMVLQECVMRYTISHMFQEILALEILSKPTVLGSTRHSTADIASILTSLTKLKASLDKIKRK
jgi:hypothetical protein